MKFLPSFAPIKSEGSRYPKNYPSLPKELPRTTHYYPELSEIICKMFLNKYNIAGIF